MRTKEVLITDTKYVIGKLSCGQVDEIIFASIDVRLSKDQVIAVVQGSKRAVRGQICPAIAAALNNAVAGNAKWFLEGWDKPGDLSAETRWLTADDVFTEFDYDEMVQLYEEVASFSKLKTAVQKGKAKPEGEETAVDAPAVN